MQLTSLSFLSVLLFSQISFAEITKTELAETKLIEWKLVEQNLELKLIQRLPDQTRSFFEARGFSKAITNDIATSCVFQTITRNNSKNKNQTLHISLKKWRIKTDGKIQPVKLKETWEQQWRDSQVKISSKIAFRWATFPTEQSFEPSGDYNWGMISFGLKPGSVFDLYVEWKTNDQAINNQTNNDQTSSTQTNSIWINNITCPKNR